MNNGSLLFFIMFLYILIGLTAAIGGLGLIIYNGIYWGKINNIFNRIQPNYLYMNKLWCVSLITWVIGIIIPLIGPIIPALVIVFWTSSSKCETSKKNFLAAYDTMSGFHKYWGDYVERHYTGEDWQDSAWFNDWFDERCHNAFVADISFICISFLPFILYGLIKLINKMATKSGYEIQK